MKSHSDRDRNNPNALIPRGFRPRTLRAHVLYGLACHALKQQDDPETLVYHARRLVELEPGQWDSWYLLGAGLMGSGQLGEAVHAFRCGIILNPENAAMHYHIGACLSDLGQSSQAYIELSRSAELDPSNGDCLNALVHAAHGRGDVEACVRYLELLDGLNEATSWEWLLAGNLLFHAGRVDEAVLSYEKAIQMDPLYAQAWNNYGFSLAHIGRIDEAITACKMSLSQDPSCAEAWDSFAVALLAAGRNEEAMVAVNTSLKCRPGFPDAEQTRKKILSSGSGGHDG